MPTLPEMLPPAEAPAPRCGSTAANRRDATIVISRAIRRTVAAALSVVATASCGFGGVNSLPLPGAVASGSGNAVYHIQIANVGTLESNSPVMIDDVTVGSVGKIRARNFHAEVDVRVRPDVVVPANAIARVGQTSLLGSMHLALDPPVGEPPTGRLEPGSTLGLNRSSTYPSTEQTLSSLSVVTNAGGLGQIGDFIHSASTALSGREGDVRELISRLDTFVGVVDDQRERFNDTINALNRLTATLSDQKDDITDALHTVPPALDVLLQERARLITAMQKLGQFSDVATKLVNYHQRRPGPQPDQPRTDAEGPRRRRPRTRYGSGLIPTYPFSQNFIDRAIRGDYINIFATIDLTYARLKRSLLLGTRWGDPNAQMVPAPGDPKTLALHLRAIECERQLPPPQDGPMPAAPHLQSGRCCRSHRRLLPSTSRRRSSRGRTDADPARTNPAGDLHHRIAHRHDGNGFRLSAGSDVARGRPHHRHRRPACDGRAVPVRQRHVPGRGDREGVARRADRYRRDRHTLAERLAEGTG